MTAFPDHFVEKFNILKQLPDRPHPLPFLKEDIYNSIPARFAKVVEKFPDRVALEEGENKLLYRELDERSNRIAQGLLPYRQGDQPVGIGVLVEKNIDHVQVLFGALKTGMYLTIMDPEYPIERLKGMIQDARMSVLVVSAGYKDLADEISSTDVTILAYEDLQTHPISAAPEVDIPPETWAILIFTSGSTGRPKAVIQTHANWLVDAWNQTVKNQMNHEDRISSYSSFYFGGVFLGLFLALLNGATYCIFNLFKVGITNLPTWSNQNEVTRWQLSPTLFRQMGVVFDRFDPMPSVRIINIGGEPIRRGDVELFLKYFSDTAFLRLGGGNSESLLLSECFVNVAYPPKFEEIPMGYAFDEKKIWIMDAEGNPVPEGEVGEIVTNGKYLSPGYLNDPELTAKKFYADPDDSTNRFYRTGDLGKYLPGGLLVHMGRKDFMVKIRGYRVQLEEVETALTSHPQVEQAVVIGREGRHGIMRLIAYIVPVKRKPPSVEALRKHVAAQLPDFMQPAAFVFIDEVPLTGSRKTDRRALPDPKIERPPLDTPYVAPSSRIEKTLADIWAQELELDKVGIDDRFSDLGGDSLTAEQIFIQIEDQIQLSLPPDVLYSVDTIRGLAANIMGHLANEYDVLLPIEPNKDPKVFMVTPYRGSTLMYKELFQYMKQAVGVYGLHSWHFKTFNISVEELAERYIQEIKRIQPEGPYYIGGFSFGGVIGYEMARRLKLQGDEIGLLFMIDTAGPGQSPQSKASLKDFVRLLFDAGKMRQKNWRVAFNNRFFEFRGAVLAWLQKVIGKQSRVVTNPIKIYEPLPYDGDILLFVGEIRESKFVSATLGWEAVVSGQIDTISLANSHHNLIYGKTAQQLVAEVVARIKAAE